VQTSRDKSQRHIHTHTHLLSLSVALSDSAMFTPTHISSLCRSLSHTHTHITRASKHLYKNRILSLSFLFHCNCCSLLSLSLSILSLSTLFHHSCFSCHSLSLSPLSPRQLRSRDRDRLTKTSCLSYHSLSVLFLSSPRQRTHWAIESALQGGQDSQTDKHPENAASTRKSLLA